MADRNDTAFLAHFHKGRDPVYFAEVFMGIRLNRAQKRWVRTACRTKKGWQWVFRRAVHVSGNQTGKTLGLAVTVLWAATYKIGIKAESDEDWDFWLNSPYNWFHLAPTYTQSMLLLADMKNLMMGAHPAQFDRETGQRRPMYWQQGLWTEKKFDNTYPGFTLFNGANIHFRTSDEKAKALQGVRAHGISFDEAAFENWLKEIMDTAVKLRLVSTGGPLWLVSTPNGINDFYEVVSEVTKHGGNTFHPRVWEAPERKLCLVWSYITDNVGYGLTKEDVDFMEQDVDASTKEQQLRGAFLEPQDAYFVPVKSIEGCFTTRLPDEQEPINGHSYVIFWDISAASDPTVCMVLDVTKKPWKGVYFRRWAKPLGLRELVSEMHRIHQYYNSPSRDSFGTRPVAVTGFDSSGMGGVLMRQELTDLTPLRPVNMTGSSKVKDTMLAVLKTAMAKRHVYFPASWDQLKREILNYRREDKKIVQDCVITAAGVTKLAAEGFSGVRRMKFDPGHKTSIYNGGWA